MTTPSRPMYYRPVFGNDNVYTQTDTVDVAAFTAPALRHKDAAATSAETSVKKSLK